jgi:hypothetical protein
MEAPEVRMGSEVEVGGSRYARGPRVQLNLDAVRGYPANARFVLDRLRGIPGVLDVAVNPSTGSVQFVYEPRRGVGETSRALTVRPRHEVGVRGRSAGASNVLGRVVKLVTLVVIEVALQRFLGAFFFRRC